MSAAAPTLEDIDAALAKAGWWMRVIEEVVDTGLEGLNELVRGVEADKTVTPRKRDEAVDTYVRVSGAIGLAIVMHTRLGEAERGLTALRGIIVDGSAAAAARAKAEAEVRVPAKVLAQDQAETDRARALADAMARDKAKARREARRDDVRERVLDVIDREAVDAEDHDALVAALDARLSVEPAFIDLDTLPLRETVIRLCAELRLEPAWSRWEANDFKPRRPRPDRHPPAPAPWPPPAAARTPAVVSAPTVRRAAPRLE